MTTFTLDTSGEVYVQSQYIHDRDSKVAVTWSDLSPFVQGYIEAALRDQQDAIWESVAIGPDEPEVDAAWGFRHLAPETLAAMLRDCAAYIGDDADEQWRRTVPGCGAEFWRNRQKDWLSAFPPLAPYLGDDGKVYLREDA